MCVLLRNFVLTFIFCWVYVLEYSLELNRRILAVTLERPVLTYENPKYGHVINFTSLRRGRSDPVHYIEFCALYFIPLDENGHVNINIYEFLSNEYRPSFVAIRFNFCEFLRALDFDIAYARNISEPIKTIRTQNEILNSNKKGCFFEPGLFCVQNLTLPLRIIPQSFPFEKGRVYVNQTYKNDLVGNIYIDLELKTLPIRKHKDYKKPLF